MMTNENKFFTTLHPSYPVMFPLFFNSSPALSPSDSWAQVQNLFLWVFFSSHCWVLFSVTFIWGLSTLLMALLRLVLSEKYFLGFYSLLHLCPGRHAYPSFLHWAMHVSMTPLGCLRSLCESFYFATWVLQSSPGLSFFLHFFKQK